jgi:hypothetical protein
MSRMKKLLDRRTRPSSVNVCTLVGLRILKADHPNRSDSSLALWAFCRYLGNVAQQSLTVGDTRINGAEQLTNGGDLAAYGRKMPIDQEDQSHHYH